MKKLLKSKIFILSLSFLALISTAAYGAYPEKPITLVVHTNPGGGADVFARFIEAVFARHQLLPQPLVIENKPGGAHANAMAYTATKAGDPYYIMTVVTPFLTTPLQGHTPLSYKDFTPIALLVLDKNVVITSSKSKFKTLKQLVDFAKENPEVVTFAISNLGGPGHLDLCVLEKKAEIQVKHVPFGGGGGEAMVGILGGHVDVGMANPMEAAELAKSGKVRMLGIVADKRMELLPDVPTLREQGYGFEGVKTMRAVVAPKGIPDEAKKVLEKAFFNFTKTEEFKKFARDQMVEEAWMDSSAFSKFLDEQNALLSDVLEMVGLKKK